MIREEGLQFCFYFWFGFFFVGMTFFPLIYPVLVFKRREKMKT